MDRYIALLRAVNVGGTGKIAMADLRALASDCGFLGPKTYINSGNLIFDSELPIENIKENLDAALAKYFGKKWGFQLRQAADLAEILAANPFPNGDPKRCVAIFLDENPPPDFAATIKNQTIEEIFAGPKVIFVNYHDGIGDSRLSIGAAKEGTARNFNTINKLLALAL